MGNKANADGWKNALPNAERNVGLSCRVPEQLRAKARKFAIDHKTTLQEVVIAALDELLKSQN